MRQGGHSCRAATGHSDQSCLLQGDACWGQDVLFQGLCNSIIVIAGNLQGSQHVWLCLQAAVNCSLDTELICQALLT